MPILNKVYALQEFKTFFDILSKFQLNDSFATEVNFLRQGFEKKDIVISIKEKTTINELEQLTWKLFKNFNVQIVKTPKGINLSLTSLSSKTNFITNWSTKNGNVNSDNSILLPNPRGDFYSFDNIFVVKCDLVGNKHKLLENNQTLKTFLFESSEQEHTELIFDRIQFYPIKYSFINTVTVEIKDTRDNFIIFEGGNVICNFVLKRNNESIRYSSKRFKY